MLARLLLLPGEVWLTCLSVGAVAAAVVVVVTKLTLIALLGVPVTQPVEMGTDLVNRQGICPAFMKEAVRTLLMKYLLPSTAMRTAAVAAALPAAAGSVPLQAEQSGTPAVAVRAHLALVTMAQPLRFSRPPLWTATMLATVAAARAAVATVHGVIASYGTTRSQRAHARFAV